MELGSHPGGGLAEMTQQRVPLPPRGRAPPDEKAGASGSTSRTSRRHRQGESPRVMGSPDQREMPRRRWLGSR